MLKPIIAEREEAVSWKRGTDPFGSVGARQFSLSMLLFLLGTSIANMALPTLAQAFNASFQEVQWIVLAYLLVITLIVSVGRLGDITGRRLLLVVALAAATANSGTSRQLGDRFHHK